MNIPEDPTRLLRRQGIRNSLSRVRTILRSVGKSDLSIGEIAAEARLRIERSKPGPSLERASIRTNRKEID
jgi:hypothetical protein